MTTKKKSHRYTKSTLSSLLALTAGFLGGYQVHQYTKVPSAVQVETANTQVRCGVKAGCTALLTSGYDKAKKTIDIAIFDLTSEEIAMKLIRCHQRGIRIRIVADNRQSKGKHSKLALLHAQGIPIRLAKVSGLMHIKLSIIDGKIVYRGSFNYTVGGENRNAECLECTQSPRLVSIYQKLGFDAFYHNGKPFTTS